MPTLDVLPQTPICAGTSVFLFSVPSTSIWTDLNGTRVFMPLTPDTTQKFIAVLTVDHCTITDTITVEVENPANFIAGPKNETIDQGESVLLWATPNAEAWLIEGTTTALTNLSVSPLQTTTYVAIWETAICGTLFDTVTINVNPPTAILLEMESGNGCSNGNGWAKVIPTSGVEPFTFAWNNGATTALIENLNPGTYTVTVTDALGATGTATATIEHVTPIQITHQTSIATDKDCSDGSIRITITGGEPPYWFEWTTPRNPDFISHAQDLLNDTAGLYSLLVVDSRGCDAKAEISLRCEFERVMPTILVTPNGDGLNDYLYIEDIYYFPINSVTILDSYGAEIATIQNFNNRDRVWDGRNRRGQFVPDGTYYFVVRAQGIPPMSGWIIVRLSPGN
jgi:gliding motility-associated-like protein